MTALEFSLSAIVELGPSTFRWPGGVEEFESGWQFDLDADGSVHRVVHRLGGREVYGRYRVHTVTWLDGEVQVEGVEADDYPTSRALLSLLRHDGRTHIRDYAEIPDDYDGFEVVRHRIEIEAPHSPNSLAVKIPEDDLLSWGRHAWTRRTSRHAATPTRRPALGTKPAALPPDLPPPPDSSQRAVADALLEHGRHLSESIGGGAARFTPDEEADALIRTDPFAFLVAVICDQGIRAERAWAIPYALQRRLGHLDPARVGAEPDRVRLAFATGPKLHRFVNNVADWVSDAGRIVASDYDGDAARIWNDQPPAAALRGRFDAFPGIGQKKAAMAVEILERDLGVTLTDLSGSDIAYDIHVRRVFLRSGIAERDDVNHMVAVARVLHPDRPGELDNPAWDVGRRWCHRDAPDCAPCPLVKACPRLIDKGAAVKGI
jgi:uncharacterized HhH-GPD family protein